MISILLLVFIAAFILIMRALFFLVKKCPHDAVTHKPPKNNAHRAFCIFSILLSLERDRQKSFPRSHETMQSEVVLNRYFASMTVTTVGFQKRCCVPQQQQQQRRHSSRFASSSSSSSCSSSIAKKKKQPQTRVNSLGTSSEDIKETMVKEMSQKINKEIIETSSLVQVGAVVAAHGLKGEVRVLPLTDFIEERFMNPGVELYVENVAQGRASKSDDYDRPIAEGKFMRVVNGRWVTSKGRTEPIVKFKGCSDRTTAEAMIGRRIYIGAESRAEIEEEDAFYCQDLEGLTVIMHEGEREVVGVVEDIYRGAGEKDLMKVLMQPETETKTNKKGEIEIDVVEYYVYIPFVKDIVPVVNIEEGLIEITPPPGLLDLKQKVGKKKNKM